MRYIELKHGIILDTKTKLLWHPKRKRLSWERALKWAATLRTARLGWRVPDRFEAESILDLTISDPATKMPGVVVDIYWSSSTYVSNPAVAWIIDFSNGNAVSYSRTNNFSVRCVSGPVDDETIERLRAV
jgi:hypothetical protein